MYVTVCTSKIRHLQCIGHTSNLQVEHFILKKSPALLALCKTRNTKKISNDRFCAEAEENIEVSRWNLRGLRDMRCQMGTSRRKKPCSCWLFILGYEKAQLTI